MSFETSKTVDARNISEIIYSTAANSTNSEWK